MVISSSGGRVFNTSHSRTVTIRIRNPVRLTLCVFIFGLVDEAQLTE